jgi:hypothetical protein
MFPYPSGAGLHVGHPLGYIASDIYARFKRHQGFNVLHPQGYDSFGYQQNNMPFKPDNILIKLPKKTSHVTANSSIKSDFLSIGAGKCALQTKIITNTRSGFLFNYSIPGITKILTKPKTFPHWLPNSKKTEMQI